MRSPAVRLAVARDGMHGTEANGLVPGETSSVKSRRRAPPLIGRRRRVKIIIDGARWVPVRKALGWTESKMWDHFGKSVTLRIKVPRLASKPRAGKKEGRAR